MKVLIIEDDKIKIEKLTSFFSSHDFEIKESYHSGIKELLTKNDYDILILDMSIPLWERGNNDIGGNFEQFGGVNILREMKRRNKLVPTILVTMFDVFANGKLTFSQLNEDLLNRFGDFYKGAVFYNASEEDKWKADLEQRINFISNQ
ncbi:hypothetical protein H9X96_21890 [Pedobacter sp. N36a]|uniref:hypothetical protein n=1 Tax=Pedobacter sp. N36a TaxID=2767996 RepID=UPI001657553D|nr:hypothetical protein [Pedobacter sp. N36a]MBC8988411.1 hypothetical protein [Pedobacter sp. N36a]